MLKTREGEAWSVGLIVGAVVYLALEKYIRMVVKDEIAVLPVILLILAAFGHGFKLIARWTAKPKA